MKRMRDADVRTAIQIDEPIVESHLPSTRRPPIEADGAAIDDPAIDEGVVGTPSLDPSSDGARA
jgi:hypothetical protein